MEKWSKYFEKMAATIREAVPTKGGAQGDPVVIGLDMASGPDLTAYWSPQPEGQAMSDETKRAALTVNKLENYWETLQAEIIALGPKRLFGYLGWRVDHLSQAARGAAVCSGYLPYDDGTNEAIYRAMHAAAPVELVSAAEDLKLAYSEIAYLNRCIARLPSPKSVAEMVNEKDAEITLLHQALAMKDARIAQLKTRLASTPVAFEDLDAKPEPVPGFWNAIRTGNKQATGLMVGPGDMSRPSDV